MAIDQADMEDIGGTQKPLTGWRKVWIPRLLTATLTIYFTGMFMALSLFFLQQLGVFR